MKEKCKKQKKIRRTAVCFNREYDVLELDVGKCILTGDVPPVGFNEERLYVDLFNSRAIHE